MMLLLHVPGLLLVSSCIFLKLGGAQNIECTVTQVGGQTLYSVPEFTGKDCDYSWLNSTNHVLADKGERTDDQVVKKSDSTLQMSKCLELIRYSCSCINEVVKREATCTINCSGNAGLQNGGEIQTEIPRHHWIVPTVVLLLLLLVFLCYKFRDNIRSCCRKFKNLCTSVKTEDNAADVEGQRG